MSEMVTFDLAKVFLDTLRRLEKEIALAAERVALALVLSRLEESAEYQAEVAAAEAALAAGFPDARPAEEALAELRAHAAGLPVGARPQR
ncbi:MAG: hypothetical protein ACRDZ3_20790 [Acidimicrobiia bacterium]